MERPLIKAIDRKGIGHDMHIIANAKKGRWIVACDNV